MELSPSAVRKDRLLEASIARDTEALAKHRWHWILDKSNEKRVTPSAYAKAVGKDAAYVKAMAKGYADYMEAKKSGESTLPIQHFISLARIPEERQTAAQAVMAARGIRSGTAHRDHGREVRAVHEIAIERATSKGTSVSEEAPVVAKELVEHSRRGEERQMAKRSRKGWQYADIESHLAAAGRDLKAAVAVARSADLNHDDVELLQASIGRVRSLLSLVEIAVTGASSVDWDAEMAKLSS